MYKIAIQKKGRLSAPSAEYLRSLGLDFDISEKSLSTACSNAPCKIISVRDDDIPSYVNNGTVHAGIIGEDMLKESGKNAIILGRLNFAFCTLVIAVPQKSGLTSIQNLRNKRIATAYPRLLSQFLKMQGIAAQIITINGAVEVAPELGIADAVCEITETGNTLKAHCLSPIATVLKSQAVLISNESQKDNAMRLLNCVASKNL